MCYQSKNSEGETAKTFVSSKEVCQACPRKDEYTNAKDTGRCISAGPYEEYLQKAREIQKTEEFKWSCCPSTKKKRGTVYIWCPSIHCGHESGLFQLRST